MSNSTEKRHDPRVQFSRGISVQIVAIDGTWRRPCEMRDVAQNGAKLSIDGSLEAVNLKEFFLVLSTTGAAFRRCELAWVNGSDIGVRFLSNEKKKAPYERR
jgi:hypothetical protein